MSPRLRHAALGCAALCAAVLGPLGLRSAGGVGVAASRLSADSASSAVLWVGPGGASTCKRASSPVDYQTALANGSVCSTGPAAYLVAQLGDTILVAGGTYTTPWYFPKGMKKAGPDGTCNYNYGGATNLTNCITFRPNPGAAVNFAVPSPTPNSGQNQVTICTDFIAMVGFTFTETDHLEASTGDTLSNTAISIGSGDNTCGTSDFPHDIYLLDNTYGGQVSVTGSTYNVWVVGGVAQSTSNLPWQFGGAYLTNPPANHSGIVGVTFLGSNFVASDPGHHHMVCVHDADSSDHITIAGDRWVNCPIGSFEANDNQTNLLIENNYFFGSALVLTVNGIGGVQSDNTVRFNSFYGGAININNECNGGHDTSACTGAIDNNVLYGNINTGCPIINFGQGGMTGSGWTSRYNVETGRQRGVCTGDSTSKYGVPAPYVAPQAPDYNLRPASGSAALYAGDPRTYPPRDIDGLVRPARVAPDAGASQSGTATLVMGKAIGAISLGASAADVAKAYNLRSVPATTEKLRTVLYRVWGREVWVRFLRGAVVGIETTSPYYTGDAGLGVGVSASAVRAAGFVWTETCHKAYRRITGSTVTYLAPSGGSRERRIASVTVLRRAEEKCPSGSH